jgi:hypothetical protein
VTVIFSCRERQSRSSRSSEHEDHEVAVAFHADHAVFRSHSSSSQHGWRIRSSRLGGSHSGDIEVRTLCVEDRSTALDRVAAAIGDRARGVVLHRSYRLEIYGENPKAGELKTDIAARGWADKVMIEVNLPYSTRRPLRTIRRPQGLNDETSLIKIEDGLLRPRDADRSQRKKGVMKFDNHNQRDAARRYGICTRRHLTRPPSGSTTPALSPFSRLSLEKHSVVRDDTRFPDPRSTIGLST